MAGDLAFDQLEVEALQVLSLLHLLIRKRGCRQGEHVRVGQFSLMIEQHLVGLVDDDEIAAADLVLQRHVAIENDELELYVEEPLQDIVDLLVDAFEQGRREYDGEVFSIVHHALESEHRGNYTALPHARGYRDKLALAFLIAEGGDGGGELVVVDGVVALCEDLLEAALLADERVEKFGRQIVAHLFELQLHAVCIMQLHLLLLLHRPSPDLLDLLPILLPYLVHGPLVL